MKDSFIILIKPKHDYRISVDFLKTLPKKSRKTKTQLGNCVYTNLQIPQTTPRNFDYDEIGSFFALLAFFDVFLQKKKKKIKFLFFKRFFSKYNNILFNTKFLNEILKTKVKN